ncbi:hypothetical protein DFS34DRAFT_618024 [Phlyctochytrium arcticum]|nr:hypothetical protein DFS34DRAFT_618024 [Phlyctochytrium arcticum]
MFHLIWRGLLSSPASTVFVIVTLLPCIQSQKKTSFHVVLAWDHSQYNMRGMRWKEKYRDMLSNFGLYYQPKRNLRMRQDVLEG